MTASSHRLVREFAFVSRAKRWSPYQRHQTKRLGALPALRKQGLCRRIRQSDQSVKTKLRSFPQSQYHIENFTSPMILESDAECDAQCPNVENDMSGTHGIDMIAWSVDSRCFELFECQGPYMRLQDVLRTKQCDMDIEQCSRL
jgi:hypothetical protein